MFTNIFNKLFNAKESILRGINAKFFNNEFLFDRAVKKYGGIYKTDNIELNIKLNNYVKDVNLLFKRYKFPKTDIFFIDNPKFNAIATVY
ncbi:MAG: hypothetical protein IPH42_03665 [Bacteroidetes bacterium]|nr:hypothetical protein [Bacteroidota bacterium]MBP9189632.1 hypothetical protein [Chitinophagales bacterium]